MTDREKAEAIARGFVGLPVGTTLRAAGEHLMVAIEDALKERSDKIELLLEHLKTRHGCDMKSEDPDYGF